jgi:predicted aspartyl protease
MKIPLDVRTYAEGLKPFVLVYIRMPKQKIHGAMYPFVDTGSPYTLISKTDADRLRIRVSGHPRTILLGGAPILSYEIKGIQLKVLCEDKKTACDISLPTIGVLKPIPNNEQSMKVVGTIPSIIGVDLLKYHRFALYFDATNNISYFEKV